MHLHCFSHDLLLKDRRINSVKSASDHVADLFLSFSIAPNPTRALIKTSFIFYCTQHNRICWVIDKRKWQEHPWPTSCRTGLLLCIYNWTYNYYCFCLARADKSVDFSPFTPLFMFIHLPLIHFAPPPRLLVDFKNSKWLTYFCILLCICYYFSHLIGSLFVTWLSLI